MVRPIMRDPLFLAGKSEPATEVDKQVVQDLLDTLKANQDRCVGMAANMIGVKKNIIVVAAGPFIVDEYLENFKEEQVGQGIKPTL